MSLNHAANLLVVPETPATRAEEALTDEPVLSSEIALPPALSRTKVPLERGEEVAYTNNVPDDGTRRNNTYVSYNYFKTADSMLLVLHIPAHGETGFIIYDDYDNTKDIIFPAFPGASTVEYTVDVTNDQPHTFFIAATRENGATINSRFNEFVWKGQLGGPTEDDDITTPQGILRRQQAHGGYKRKTKKSKKKD